MKRLFDLAMKYYRKYREVIVYLITGGITTVINFAVFFTEFIHFFRFFITASKRIYNVINKLFCRNKKDF